VEAFVGIEKMRILALQWKDTKVVTLLTTLDCADEYNEISRKTKSKRKWDAPVQDSAEE